MIRLTEWVISFCLSFTVSLSDKCSLCQIKNTFAFSMTLTKRGRGILL